MGFGELILLIIAIVLVALLGIVTFQRNRFRDQRGTDEYWDAEQKITWTQREKALLQQLDIITDNRDERSNRINELQALLREKETTHESELADERRRVTARITELETEHIRRQSALELEFTGRKREEARLTAARSRTALVAKIGEHFAPLLSGFPYNFKDCRHVGELFDFLVFDGLEEGKIKDIVFLEIKTKASGGRVTNRRERMLRKAIDEGRVRYDVFVPDTNGAKSINTDELVGGDDSNGED